MHIGMLKEIIRVCQQRHNEGDCPTVPAFTVEQLEEAIIELVQRLPSAALLTLKVTDEWLRRKIAEDGDDEPMAAGGVALPGAEPTKDPRQGKKCGACSRGDRKDCSGWCYCPQGPCDRPREPTKEGPR